MENRNPPTTTQYLTPLVSAGLEPDQAVVYEVLIKSGPLKASKVAAKSPLKRGLVYKVLDELVELGLVTKNEPSGKVAIFEPAHPLKLKDIAEAKEAKLKTAQLALDGIMGQLSSDYNLSLNKPGVIYFEGIEGVQKILNDSLAASTPIYSYIDNEAVNKFFPEINREYVKKRNRLKIQKKMITIDSEYIRKHATTLNKSTTEIRVVPAATAFTTVMQIYDNKVSYLSMQEKKVIGILIEHPQIAKMHKELFELQWQSAKPLDPQAPSSPVLLA